MAVWWDFAGSFAPVGFSATLLHCDRVPIHDAGARVMSNHEQRSHKEKKKQPVHTAKEKKAAKRAKKHEGDHPQFLVKKS
jgi:hypothetical protein